MGGEDAAYDRTDRTGVEDDTRGVARSGSRGYTYHVEIHEGKGHWMEREDAVAVLRMAGHTRDLRPERIVWLQDDVTSRFYWLAVDDPVARRRMVVERDGQTIRIEAGGGRALAFDWTI